LIVHDQRGLPAASGWPFAVAIACCALSGTHSGVIYLRGQVELHQQGRKVDATDLDADDRATLGGW